MAKIKKKHRPGKEEFQSDMFLPEGDWVFNGQYPSLSDATLIGLDSEVRNDNLKTLGPGGFRGDGFVAGFGIATNTGYSNYYPLRHLGGGNIVDGDPVGYLKNICSLPTPKVLCNALFDMEWFWTLNVHLKGPIIDISVAEALINEEAESMSLDALAFKYLGLRKEEDELHRIAEAHKLDAKGDMWRLPASAVGKYGAADPLLTLRIWEKQKVELKRQGLLEVFDIECRLLPLLLEMRRIGVPIDQNKAKNYRIIGTSKKKLFKKGSI
jgi:DNA polymerase I-like protein with 3'-5' exonuclease and polymerase domains